MKISRYGSFLSHMRRLSVLYSYFTAVPNFMWYRSPNQFTVKAADRSGFHHFLQTERNKAKYVVTATATNTRKDTRLQMLPFCTGSRKQPAFLFRTVRLHLPANQKR